MTLYDRTRNRLSVLALVATLAGCGGEAMPGLVVTASELATPAADRSGEPFLSSAPDGVFMSWLETGEAGGHELRFSKLTGGAWSESSVVASGDRFFANWADFPSMVQDHSGTLWAHWLERGPEGGYDYGIRVVRSSDGGAGWSEPWTPHDDGTRTEHGFVSILPTGSGVTLVWLDGRGYAPGADGSEARMEMSIRARTVDADGVPGPETLLDARTCDCCQTDAISTEDGPIVIYRNRTEEEIRDIYVTRLRDGAWTEGRAVHDDGWEIGGCPVNGPAIAAGDGRVAVAWFTGAGGAPRVKLAWSTDDAESFGMPVAIDDGNPAGRVDLLMLPDGDALVSWLERTGGDKAEVRMRRVRADGTSSESATVVQSSSARGSGFPRMIATPDGSLVVAWTDVSSEGSRVMTRRLEVEGS
jgi:hypothetical protein